MNNEEKILTALEKPSIIERVNTLEEEVASLKSAMKMLEKRLDALEKAQ